MRRKKMRRKKMRRSKTIVTEAYDPLVITFNKRLGH